MKKNIIIILVIILVAVASGAFYGGMLYSKTQAQNARANFTGGNFQGMRNRTGATGGGVTFGNIISKDSNSITLELPNSSGSKIIFYSNTTQISKFASGTANDLATGTSVTVNGTANSDGSITAQNIQIRPAK